MKITISGSSGLIGSKLCEYFIKKEYHITKLLRADSPESPDCNTASWQPEKGAIDAEALENMDCVIHLSGASIANRWTPEYKEEILGSRLKSTKLLAETIAKLKNPPKVFICASAIGIYGNHDSEQALDEHSPVADDFLADVCKQWETSSQAAAAATRVVHLRFGVVLGKNGGALAQMLPPFKLGVGGKLGNGKQMFSWIALDEIPLIVEFVAKSNLAGAINATAPHPVTNAEFTIALGQAINRPTALPVPEFAVKAMFGEMGKTLLLGGAKVLPKKLSDAGYPFKYPSIDKALEHIFQEN